MFMDQDGVEVRKLAKEKKTKTKTKTKNEANNQPSRPNKLGQKRIYCIAFGKICLAGYAG